jgi:hypothetical protein
LSFADGIFSIADSARERSSSATSSGDRPNDADLGQVPRVAEPVVLDAVGLEDRVTVVAVAE